MSSSRVVLVSSQEKRFFGWLALCRLAIAPICHLDQGSCQVFTAFVVVIMYLMLKGSPITHCCLPPLKKDIFWCWSVRNQYKSVNTNTSNIYYLLFLNHDLDPVAESLTLSYPLIKLWILDLINHLNWTSFQLSLFLNY